MRWWRRRRPGRSADQLDTALGDLFTNGGAFDVAAEVGCCAVHDHGTTLETLDAGCGEQHRGLRPGTLAVVMMMSKPAAFSSTAACC